MAPARATFTRLMAVVVLLSGGYGASVVLHHCPHHHGPAGATPADPVHPAAARGATHGATHGSGHGSTHGSGQDAACTCIGPCCSSAVAPLASALPAPDGPVPAAPALPVASWPLDAGPRAAPAPYFHAFPNPPPTTG